MAIVKIGPAINLQTADSPFNDIVEMFQLRTIVLTPAAADATLTLFQAATAAGAGNIIGVYIARANTSSLVIPFPVDKETPRWSGTLSVTLAGVGAQAFIYLA